MGKSLRVALAGGELIARQIVSELLQVGARPDPRQRYFVSVRDGDQRIILGTDGQLERFDLSHDPEEQHALSAEPERFRALLDETGVEFDYEGYASPEFSEPTPEMRQNLKALGYIR